MAKIDTRIPPPTRLFTMHMQMDLYMRLRALSENEPVKRRSMARLIHEALEAYLPTLEERALTFDEIYVRDRPEGVPALPPSPITRARSYGAKLDPLTARPQFLSPTLRQHHDQKIWNQHTWALIEREFRWRAECGEPLEHRGIPYPGEMAGDESHLPHAAKDERGPHGKL